MRIGHNTQDELLTLKEAFSRQVLPVVPWEGTPQPFVYAEKALHALVSERYRSCQMLAGIELCVHLHDMERDDHPLEVSWVGQEDPVVVRLDGIMPVMREHHPKLLRSVVHHLGALSAFVQPIYTPLNAYQHVVTMHWYGEDDVQSLIECWREEVSMQKGCLMPEVTDEEALDYGEEFSLTPAMLASTLQPEFVFDETVLSVHEIHRLSRRWKHAGLKGLARILVELEHLQRFIPPSWCMEDFSWGEYHAGFMVLYESQPVHYGIVQQMHEEETNHLMEVGGWGPYTHYPLVETHTSELLQYLRHAPRMWQLLTEAHLIMGGTT